MPADTSVKFLHSAMTGAPSLSGTAGALIAVLDACLVNGFGTGTVDSVVVASGVATVTRSAGHPMEVGAVALLAGAGTTAINGEKKVMSVPSSTTYTFDATGVADGTISGTITHKLAPAGWTKSFAGTNLAAYKSSDVTATGCYLCVDDTGTTMARAVGYESMIDVNTGSAPFPQAAQLSGGVYWSKSAAADATSRPWIVVADSKVMYLLTAYTSNTSTSFDFTCLFGDIASVKSPDAYCCAINGNSSSSFGTNGANASVNMDHGDSSNAALALYLARSFTGVGSPAQCRKAFPFIAGSSGFRSGTSGVAYPNGADGGIYVAPHYIIEHATSTYRGLTPGFYCSVQNIGASTFANRDSITGVVGLAGKTLRAVNSNTGAFFFDTTGPWRS